MSEQYDRDIEVLRCSLSVAECEKQILERKLLIKDAELKIAQAYGDMMRERVKQLEGLSDYSLS